jgi:hypothetical protein
MRIITLGLAAAVAVFLSCDAIAAAAWQIESLPDSAPLYQQSGCMGSFGLKGHATDTVFLDDSVDVKAKANIKLGGKIFALDLVSAKTSGKNGADSSGPGTHFDRVFKDKTGAVSVTAALIAGKEHPDADSTEMTGTLSVSWQGTTQKIAVVGGVAC